MALHADTYQRVLCQIPNAEVSTLVPAQLPGKNQAQICKDSLSRVLYCLGSLIIQDVYWSTHICYKSSTAHSRPAADAHCLSLWHFVIIRSLSLPKVLLILGLPPISYSDVSTQYNRITSCGLALLEQTAFWFKAGPHIFASNLHDRSPNGLSGAPTHSRDT